MAKQGDLATFDYVVPKGDVNISVVFKARGFPDHAQCGSVDDGPTVVGSIAGTGVNKHSIPRDWTYPVPQPVPDLIDSQGRFVWGLLEPVLFNTLTYVSVCSSSGCTKYQIQGQFHQCSTIKIRSCTTVTATGCPQKVGECVGRSQKYLKETEDHENKHYDIYRELVHTWNDKVEDAPLYQSPEDAYAKIMELRRSFNEERARVDIRQQSHCPDFAGDSTRGHDGCGREFFVWVYVCP